MSHEQDDEEPKEKYLGDGLYALFDGYAIRLRAPRIDGDHFVYLEPDIYQNLVSFVKRIREGVEQE